MQSFTYYTPTKVVFGRGAENQTGALARAFGAHKVLVHFGGKSARASGLLDRVTASLKEAGLGVVELGGVVPNPRLSLVRQGIELCKKEGVDFLLAVGGGSVIDSAKAIGYGLANEGDVWDFYDHLRDPEACMPIGCVLTIAAAGSEMSNSSVITNEEGWLKRGCNTDYCRPRFAVMNPELTATLPAYQTACGCTDIMMHTMERYLGQGGSMTLTDRFAVQLVRTVMDCALVLRDDPQNYDARAEVMWASSLSHNGLTGCGGSGDWASHQLEHELGGMFDVAHGAGLAAVWGSWARYVLNAGPARFVSLLGGLFELPKEGDDTAKALAGIERMEAFFRSIGMPASLHELGVAPTEEQMCEMAEKSCWNGRRTIGGMKQLTAGDALAIYRMAL